MVPPRSAFGAAPPGGASRDTKGPADLSCAASGRGARPGAACKARQRTGEAGSAAAAWTVAAWRLGVLSLALGAAASSALAQGSGRTPKPVIEPAKPGTQCVADPATMRRQHPRMLEHQRDETVHGGIRGAQASLKACIACHASPSTGSVAAADTNFCISCHTYTAVRIDCFECHSTRPAPTAFHPVVPTGPNAAAAMRLAQQLRQMGAAGVGSATAAAQ